MMHWPDLILILLFAGAGYAGGYLLLLYRLRRMVTERDLKIADQIASLDDAIRALETRLAEHHAATELIEAAQLIADSDPKDEAQDEKQEEIAPDIQAVIAAAAVATLGQDVHIRSIKSATSSWSQQGRVMVQGSHNARARR
jgi:hypothetical protein